MYAVLIFDSGSFLKKDYVGGVVDRFESYGQPTQHDGVPGIQRQRCEGHNKLKCMAYMTHIDGIPILAVCRMFVP